MVTCSSIQLQVSCVWVIVPLMSNALRAGLENLLREGGHKITPGRVAILETLKATRQPMTISDIARRLRNKINQVTIYRALEALTRSGVVCKVNLQNSSTNYELVAGAHHHHHVVCEQCGVIEDVENCDIEKLEKTVLKQSRRFDSIKTHSLEFFGTCNTCVK